jgi:hypothetical protein
MIFRSMFSGKEINLIEEDEEKITGLQHYLRQVVVHMGMNMVE